MPRAIVIINRKSGSAANAEALAGATREALGSRGVDCDVRLVEPPELPQTLDGIEPGQADLLVIGGGDGSIRAAAATALKLDIPLAVLPLGTMNLVARDLGIPLRPGDAAASLVSDRFVHVDVGRVNGSLFLHSAVLGVVPRMGEERERDRGRRGLFATVDLLERMWRTVRRERPMRADIQLRHDRTSEQAEVKTYMIAVSANRLSGRFRGRPLARDVLDGGELGVYWSTHRNLSGLLQLLGELGAGLWGLDDRVVRRAATEVLVRVARGGSGVGGWPGRRTVLVSVDGEVERTAQPVRFTVQPRALRMLVPPPVAAEATVTGSESEIHTRQPVREAPGRGEIR